MKRRSLFQTIAAALGANYTVAEARPEKFVHQLKPVNMSDWRTGVPLTGMLSEDTLVRVGSQIGEPKEEKPEFEIKTIKL